MNQNNKFNRVIATFFLVIFFPTLVPNSLYASNNGPNAFDAASFEPVDSQDMVNLATGDLSYVLPLLNVPSPEGGYPLALSYHAGIAMDQEASWVGLGWGLNPGAISRSVNGSPDDVNSGQSTTFLYDQGGQLSFYRTGVGVNLYGINAGVGAYWGSNKTFGGSVSFGLGPVSFSVEHGSAGTSVGLGGIADAEQFASAISTGVSFGSVRGMNSFTNGSGVGRVDFSFSQSDYIVEQSSGGINVNLGFVNFYYGKTKVTYSLFKQDNINYSGILYSKWDKSPDVNKIAVYDQFTDNIDDIKDDDNHYLTDNVLLPNYDRYRVNAQGISGSISPNVIEEMDLYSKNYNKLNYFGSSKYIPKWVDYFKLNNNVFFEFENTNTSFLRINRSNIERDLVRETSSSAPFPDDESNNVLACAKTNNSNIYNENVTADGIALKNGNRKRNGKYVESLTNQQILSSSSAGNFIEAKNLNRNQPNLYKPESIGGYKVVDVDGKVYHYSLPVMNYETWYRNYSDANNENSFFGENETKEPFATDWLLTAVTGPDYIDTNGNNILDSTDYGYWVEFDYGKWSDGYIWNGSSGKNDVVKGESGNPDRYEHYKGRKQIYYLDAVRTRTHTAYFIKSLRNDAQGQEFKLYTNRATNGLNFNANQDSGVWRSGHFGYCNDPEGCPDREDGQGPLNTLNQYNVPRHDAIRNVTIENLHGWQYKYRYMDFPAHKSLKLDKIILVKNNDLLIDKSNGSSLVNDKKAFMYENSAFEVDFAYHRDYLSHLTGSRDYNGVYYASNDMALKTINIHQNENIYDVNDIAGIDVTSKAVKVIDFGYDPDYPLVKNSLNSSASSKGRLTLNSVKFLGKEGKSAIPRFKFKYNNPNQAFSNDNEDDWGYNKTNPDSWSLNEIETPLGSKMKISYESDDYNCVAVYPSANPLNKGKGGGIRVKEIANYNETGVVNKVKYFYNESGFDKESNLSNYKSSGVISYVPSKTGVIPYISELPPPIVMYKNVSMEVFGKDDTFLSGTNYNFETLENHVSDINYTYNLGGNYFSIKKKQDVQAVPHVRFKKYEIKSFLNNLGRLKSVRLYNSKNQILSSVSHEYAAKTNSDLNYGVKENSYISKYYTNTDAIPRPKFLNSTNKITYSGKLLSTKSTVNGSSNTTYYEKYDFLTGNVIEIKSVSSDGKSFKTKVVPAYSKYLSMGSKVDNSNNKNMLTQIAVEYSYIYDPNDVIKPWKETGVGITTWNNEWTYQDIIGDLTTPTLDKEKVWRKHKTYVWNGIKDQGIFTSYNSLTGDDGFNWSVGVGTTQPAQWKQTSEVTLYNHYSNILEMKDINNNRAATKMGDDDTKTTAVGNAKYNELYFSGMENIKSDGIWLEPGIKINGAARISGIDNVHTGNYALKTTNSSQLIIDMKSGQHKSGKYKINVWVRKDNVSNARISYGGTSYEFNGTESNTAGDWVLKTHYVNIPTSAFQVNLTSANAIEVIYDDVMLRPIASSITGYVYNKYNELSFIIGNNGLATWFEYDDDGRLWRTHSEVIDDPDNFLTGGFKLKAESKLKYKNNL